MTAKVTLPTDEQILITREFDAPKHLVYKAWTTPELVKRWWRPVERDATLALLVQTTSKELRDVIVNSGMEVGMQEQMDLLEQIAISLP